jgi:hypothetical protein
MKYRPISALRAIANALPPLRAGSHRPNQRESRQTFLEVFGEFVRLLPHPSSVLALQPYLCMVS